MNKRSLGHFVAVMIATLVAATPGDLSANDYQMLINDSQSTGYSEPGWSWYAYPSNSTLKHFSVNTLGLNVRDNNSSCSASPCNLVAQACVRTFDGTTEHCGSQAYTTGTYAGWAWLYPGLAQWQSSSPSYHSWFSLMELQWSETQYGASPSIMLGWYAAS